MSDEQDPNEALADEWAAALEEQADDETPAQAESQPDATAPGWEELQEFPATSGDSDIQMDAILDVPVTIAMEIGRTQINIRNLLHLNQGSVVELDRLAGEPMDVLVNGTLIAKGEVVVVNEKFGIRLTDIVSPADRVKRLQGG
jgi:flagellar motor switch protein FliN/FliY